MQDAATRHRAFRPMPTARVPRRSAAARWPSCTARLTVAAILLLFSIKTVIRSGLWPLRGEGFVSITRCLISADTHMYEAGISLFQIKRKSLMDKLWKNAVIRYNSDLLFRAEIHRKACEGDKIANAILATAVATAKA